MPVSVTLGQHFEEFVQGQLDSGRYNDASEVLKDALRLMEDHEKRLAAFRAPIAAGIQDGVAGRVHEPEDVLHEILAEIDAPARPAGLMKVIISAVAKADLQDIALFIGQDNKKRAKSFIRDLIVAALRIGDMPLAFPFAPHCEDLGVRRRPVGNYLIFYQIQNNQVLVVHILHAARDYEAAMMQLFTPPPLRESQ